MPGPLCGSGLGDSCNMHLQFGLAGMAHSRINQPILVVCKYRGRNIRYKRSLQALLVLTTGALLYCYYGHRHSSLAMQSQLVHPGIGRISTKPAASVRVAACAPRPFTLARSHSHSQPSRTDGRSIAARSLSDNQFDVDTGSAEQLPVELGPRPDDILPDSLADAVSQVSTAATARGDPWRLTDSDVMLCLLAGVWLHASLQQGVDVGTAAACCCSECGC
jgi:hypothetical protein